MSRAIKIGISIGDTNGVGLEIILKSFHDKRMLDFCTPILFGDYNLAMNTKKQLGLEDIYLNRIQSLKESKNKKVNVLNCWKETLKPNYGSKEDGGKYALKSLQKACQALQDGSVDVLVTAPINKENIQSDSFKFPGHTEFLEQQFDGQALMLMLNNDLRIGVVTGHLPLEQVSKHITQELILQKLQLFNQSLIQDFGVRKPKIAVLGLNPHAGDNGLLGKEEEETIIPALQKAEDKGILAFGPYPADGFFGSNKLKAFDGVLAMYHDQGLVPFKTLSFGNGVNFTSGLSVVRTSPDHGTAFDIAGKNIASESSFIQAIYTACDIYKKRQEWQELNSNILPSQPKKEKARER
jgi:4-hydroxythreonine-4-phosphate dehydrogenase